MYCMLYVWNLSLLSREQQKMLSDNTRKTLNAL